MLQQDQLASGNPYFADAMDHEAGRGRIGDDEDDDFRPPVLPKGKKSIVFLDMGQVRTSIVLKSHKKIQERERLNQLYQKWNNAQSPKQVLDHGVISFLLLASP